MNNNRFAQIGHRWKISLQNSVNMDAKSVRLYHRRYHKSIIGKSSNHQYHKVNDQYHSSSWPAVIWERVLPESN